MKEQSPFVTAFWICVGLIALGLFPMPYGYYTLLRLILCGVCVWGIILVHERQVGIAAGLGVAALLYNPVMPIHLGAKTPWVAINLATLVLLYFVVRQLKPVLKEEPDKGESDD